MATGYTQEIRNDISFRQFALDCAKAFGACIMLRDEPPGGELIPDEFKPEPYYEEILKTAESRLESFLKMSKEEISELNESRWEEAEFHRCKELAEIHSLLKKYTKMLLEVENWTPPTPEHYELKEFMISQLKSSIDFDCGVRITAHYSTPTPRVSDEKFAEEELQRLKSGVQFAAHQLEKEISRVNSRNKWIQELRKSLPRP